METILIGIGLIAAGFLYEFFYNPTSVFASTLGGFIKIIGVIMIISGIIDYVKEDKAKSFIKPSSVTVVDKSDDYDDSDRSPSYYDDNSYAPEIPSYDDSYNSVMGNDEPSYKAPTGHYVEIEESCIECGGKGYNIKQMWHGGDRVSEVKVPCIRCHQRGRITRREYVMD